MDSKAYLVPHDFSTVADAAVRHALQLARQTKGSVHLLHIVKSSSEKAEAHKKFAELVPKLQLSNEDPKLETHVEEGNIFVDIARVAKEVDASLIIMGTHGAKGMQKVFGSFAIKVIVSTDVPFMIVQDRMPAEKIRSVVFPLALASESLQVMNVAASVALDFDAEITLLAQKETDNALARKISIHLEVVKKQLHKRGVKYQIQFVEKTKNFHTTVIDFGKKNSADLIAIAYHSESMLPQFDPFAQSIITNEVKIPVLIINSKESGSLYF